MARTKFPLERADDGLSLDVEIDGLTPTPTPDGWVLTYDRDDGDFAVVTVRFPPQHVVEYADTPLGQAPAQKKPILAPPTQVVFLVAPTHAPIPLSVAGILAALPHLPVLTPGTSPTQSPVDNPAALAGAAVASRSHRAAGGTEVERRSQLAHARRAADGESGTEPGTAEQSSTSTSTSTSTSGDDDDLPEVPVGTAPTSVGVPARLELAIAKGGTRFTHAAEPVDHGGRIEQWHTRLASITKTPGAPPIEVTTPVRVSKAVVTLPSTDEAGASHREVVDEAKIRNTLTPAVAAGLVDVTAVTPLLMRHLTLSPAGASLDMDRSWKITEQTWPWNAEKDPTIEAYRHRVSWGRDAEVRVVERGRVLPFGHEAILTTTTQRAPRLQAEGFIAPLRTTSVLTIYQPVREFSAGGEDGRAWPWARVEVLNPVSPPGVLDPAGQTMGRFVVADGAGGKASFALACRATDRAGNDVEFTVPAFWASLDASNTQARNAWNALDAATFRQIDLGGRPVMVAPPGAASPGGADTTMVVAKKVEMKLGAGNLAPRAETITGFSPVLDGIAGAEKAAEATFRFASAYLTSGFDAGDNPGELLLDLVTPQAARTLAKDAKALAEAGLAPVRALSRRLGAVAVNGTNPTEVAARLAKVVADEFDPLDWLGDKPTDLPAQLFGVFPLRELLALRTEAKTLADAPRQLTEMVNGTKELTSTWGVDLLKKSEVFAPAGTLVSLTTAEDGPPEETKVHLQLTTVVSIDPATQVARASSTTVVTGAVLKLVPFDDEHLVTLPIDEITFTTTDSAAPDIDVDMGTVSFGGPLSYVKTLADLLAKSGFAKPPGARLAAAADARLTGARTAAIDAGDSDADAARAALSPAIVGSTLRPSAAGATQAHGQAQALADGPPPGPSIVVSDGGVRAGLAIAVPDVAIGMFALRDLAFASAFEVFFDGRPPRLSLDFATIDNPFRVAVSALGGGGHLAVRVSATGLELVAGALEFGASASIDLGLAKGSASIMGGIYFELSDAGLALTGYLDIRGKLEVLSIVSLSVAVTLSLTYVPDTAKVEGTAEVVLKVKVLFFKKTVRFEVHRRFAGGNADPTFAELMAPADWPDDRPLPWDSYCGAFAAAA